jgi:hypothetical protein
VVLVVEPDGVGDTPDTTGRVEVIAVGTPPLSLQLAYGPNEEGRVLEAFTPDFYLPEQDLFLEITVMKQRLVTRKNRKLRKLRERYPGIQVKLFYKRDIERLAQRYRLDLAS